MGLKTASDFLKDLGFSKYLAVVDSRVLTFLQDVNLISRELRAATLSNKKTYYHVEETENTLTGAMGITVSELDEKIMAYTGGEKSHKI